MARTVNTRLKVEQVGAAASGAKSGQKVVTTAGTAVVLAASREIEGPILIKALEGNTGKIYVGNDGANDVTSANGYELGAGDSLQLNYVSNIASIYIDSSVNGEGVSWTLLYY
jgi:hypothetical protein